jgi:hypothetical protein
MASYFIHQTITGIPCDRVGFFPDGMTGLTDSTGIYLFASDSRSTDVEASFYFYNFLGSSLLYSLEISALSGVPIAQLFVDVYSTEDTQVINLLTTSTESTLSDSLSIIERPCPIRVRISTAAGEAPDLFAWSFSLS